MTEQVGVRELGRPGDLGWVLQAHGELYAAEYGWSVEPVTARILADVAASAPGRDRGWIAEVDGVRAGSVFRVHVDDRTAKLRLLLVTPAARGRGAGTRLVETCMESARAAGYEQLVLWTNEPLDGAKALYLRAGFRLTAEERHDEFGVTLLGQEYAIDL